jgi:hypothetical protein
VTANIAQFSTKFFFSLRTIHTSRNDIDCTHCLASSQSFTLHDIKLHLRHLLARNAQVAELFQQGRACVAHTLFAAAILVVDDHFARDHGVFNPDNLPVGNPLGDFD